MYFTTLASLATALSTLALAHPSPQSSTTEETPSCPPGGYRYLCLALDTIDSISLWKNVSTLELAAVNDLTEDSELFPNWNLCIPPTCRVHEVTSDEEKSCEKIASKTGVSVQALRLANPYAAADCGDVRSGSNVCLSVPGQ